MASPRQVLRIVTAAPTYEGAGFLVHRPFPVEEFSYFDPFLLLDEMGPSKHAPGEAKGAPDHPHRGFETVTYLLEGEMEHRDSNGNRGKLGPGDVQWMTAGAGVIHSEMPSREFQASGGTMHGFQLWVNLPSQLKMSSPRYQELKTSAIPTVEVEGVVVRVIAGSFREASSPASTHVPILYLDVTLPAGGQVELPVPEGFNAMAFVISGEIELQAERPVQPHELAIFSGAGELVRASSTSGGRMLLIGGRPVDEPVARYGPFVMNTREEIIQAVIDYQEGRMGAIAPEIVNLE